MRYLLALGLLLFSLSGWAKVFETSYLTIELPENWQCLRNSTIWICRVANKDKADAIIYMTAKASGNPQDMSRFYKSIMDPRTITGKNNIPIQSKVQEAKKLYINGVEWFRAFHLNSEIENFYTYYLASHNENLAVFVSINIYAPAYKQYVDMLSKAMYSLKLKPVNIKAQTAQSNQWQTYQNEGEVAGGSEGSSLKRYLAFGLILGAVLIVLFVLFKK